MNPDWRKNYIRYRSYFLNVLSTYKEKEDIRAYLEIILSLATVIVFSIFALRPTFLTIGKLIKEIEAKRLIIKEMDVKINDLAESQAVYTRYSDQINLLEISIPGTPQPDVLIRQIEGLSQNRAVNLSTFNIEKVTLKGVESPTPGATDSQMPEGTGSITFTLDIVDEPTSYPKLSGFLSDLTTLRVPVKIEEMIFTTSEELGKDLTLVITGKIPYLKGN